MYQVTVSVENEEYCGEFLFSDLYDAAQKVMSNISALNGGLDQISDEVTSSLYDDESAFFWCEDERGSYCKVDRV